MRAQALTTLTSRLRQATRDTAGNAMLLFAFCLPVMVFAAGSALDYGRAIDAKQTMASALDAATLAAARALSDGETSERKITAIAQAMFKANVEANGGAFSAMPTIAVDVDKRGRTVSATADARVPSTLMRVAGIDEMEIGVESVAGFDTTTIELAMVLDVTGSMEGSKLRALKRAATSLLDTLLPEDAGSNDRVRISLVPYAWSVNAGRYASVATDGQSNRCVTERGGASGHSDIGPDRLPVGADSRARCPRQELRPLTTDGDQLRRDVQSFRAQGYTAGHIGASWGYYTLSPRWRNVWPASADPRGYGAEDNVKIMILMTDGKFNTFYDGVEAGYFGGQQTRSEAYTRAVCDNMKDDDIIIYSVAFDSPSDAKRLLEDCATTTERHFFTPETNDELVADFMRIAAELKNLRLTR